MSKHKMLNDQTGIRSATVPNECTREYHMHSNRFLNFGNCYVDANPKLSLSWKDLPKRQGVPFPKNMKRGDSPLKLKWDDACKNKWIQKKPWWFLDCCCSACRTSGMYFELDVGCTYVNAHHKLTNTRYYYYTWILRSCCWLSCIQVKLRPAQKTKFLPEQNDWL